MTVKEMGPAIGAISLTLFFLVFLRKRRALKRGRRFQAAPVALIGP
jgi:hypothetical protein